MATIKPTRFPEGIQAPIVDKTTGAEITAITDNTGGTASSTNTLGAISAGASYTQADMQAVQAALATLAAIINEYIGH